MRREKWKTNGNTIRLPVKATGGYSTFFSHYKNVHHVLIFDVDVVYVTNNCTSQTSNLYASAPFSTIDDIAMIGDTTSRRGTELA